MNLRRRTTVSFLIDLEASEQFRLRPHPFARTRIITMVRVETMGYVELLGHVPGSDAIDIVRCDVFGNTYFEPNDVPGLPDSIRMLLPALGLETKFEYEDIPTRR